MCGNIIHWSAFDWQSFSTLLTGAAIVFVTFRIGKLQEAIQKRQCDIDAESLKIALFDRRLEVFDKTEKFIKEIIQSGHTATNATKSDFLLYKQKSKFLFEDSVCKGLDEIFENEYNLDEVYKRIYLSIKNSTTPQPQDTQQQKALQEWFGKQLQSLHQLFKDIKLGGKL